MKKTKKGIKISKNVRRISIMLILMIAILVMCVIVVNSKKSNPNISEKTSSEVIDASEEKNKNNDEEMIAEITSKEQTGDTSWDEQAEDTKVDITNNENSEKNNKSTYYIKVNYTANCVTIYKKDNSGNYTIPVKSMVCSTGKATPTSGVYRMSDKYRWHMLEGGVYGQYCSRITGHILFHSVPYLTNSPDTLEYWAYDKLGTKASAGCIRLTVQDAKWIHANCASGTYVEFYSSSDPGPLGKPSAQKISWNETCRDWDPTDPDSRNPWHTYVAPQPETPKIEENIQQPEEPDKPETQLPENLTNTNNNTSIENNSNEIENNTTITNNTSNTNETTNTSTNEINSTKEENKVVENTNIQ